MRVLNFLIPLLLGVASAAESRQAETMSDRHGNVKVFQGIDANVDDSVKQAGEDNRIFLYRAIPSGGYADSIDIKQDGKENKILSFISGEQPFHQLLKQRGDENSVLILQSSKHDSTAQDPKGISVHQKGNGNRVTITRN
ncbi:MAG: hypothetical protein R6V27_08160 [Balneolaceae bacterium]